MRKTTLSLHFTLFEFLYLSLSDIPVPDSMFNLTSPKQKRVIGIKSNDQWRIIVTQSSRLMGGGGLAWRGQ